MVQKTVLIMGAMVLLTFLFVASFAIAAHPASGSQVSQTPVMCPPIALDADCTADGSAASNDYTQALGMAGRACDLQYGTCQMSQRNEYTTNKTLCESVPGCELSASVVFDVCEGGNSTNCSPDPTISEDSNNTTYTCHIEGQYNITNYNCQGAAVQTTPSQ